MKRFNITIAVVLFTLTTVILVAIPMQANLDLGQWAALVCLTLIGYLTSYLHFDSYIDRVKDDVTLTLPFTQIWNNAYDEGYKDGRKDLKKELSADSMNAIVDQDLIDLEQF